MANDDRAGAGTNPSTATAKVLVASLVECGVTDVVLAPGSRSAALALALADAEANGDLVLHVRFDERSAGFLALGLAKRFRRPVPVVVTSGTAVAELLPSMVEASYSGVPLVAITADRPSELRGTGANQTIEQVGVFGTAPRMTVDLPAPEAVTARGLALVQSSVARTLAAAMDPFDGGPIQLNVAFREPIVPGADDGVDPVLVAALESPALVRDERLTAAMVLPVDESLAQFGPLAQRGAIVVGDVVDDESREAATSLADACGWPLIVEPSGLPSVDSDTLIAHASLLLADPHFREGHQPDLVITVGRIGLSRGVMALVGSAPTHVVVDPRPADRWADPLRTAALVLGAVPEPPTEFVHDPKWLSSWRQAADTAEDVVSAILDDEDRFTGPTVARLVMAAAEPAGVVLVAASWPVRHVEAYALPRDEMPLVVGNRGASGIDGLISTAWGVATAHQRDARANDPHAASPGYALLGDLAFLYDVNGLLAGAGESRPDLVIVVIDNDGGGIFSSLEQSAPRFEQSFDRVFGSPHGRDLVAVAEAHGTPARRVSTSRELLEAMDEAVAAGGVRVIVAATGSRANEADVVRAIQADVSSAVR